MNTVTVPDIEFLFCKLPLKELSCGHYYFRGVANSSYELIPTIGRQQNACEKKFLDDFRIKGRGLVQCEPHNLWEWMALAQHHGIPTRLLDWSSSMLTALYFASTKNMGANGLLENHKTDCALYVAHCCNFINIEEDGEGCLDPLHCPQTGFVVTPHIATRMSGQDGLFSIQNDPSSDFAKQYESIGTENHITKYIIPLEVREEVFFILQRIGFRTGTIFPDLDGLSKEIKQNQSMECCFAPSIPWQAEKFFG